LVGANVSGVVGTSNEAFAVTPLSLHSNHYVLKVVAPALIVWLLVLVGLEWVSVVNDSGVRVGFANGPAFLDFGLYSTAQANNLSVLLRPFDFLGLIFFDGLPLALQWLQQQPIQPGPVYPLLIQLFAYPSHPWLLASFYLVLGILLGLSWAQWAARQNEPASAWLQVGLAAFPFLVYYTVLVSTDLLFAVFTWLMWRVIQKPWFEKPLGLSVVVLIVAAAVLTRPTALVFIPIALVSLAYMASGRVLLTALGLAFTVSLSFIAAWGLVFYAPYYLVHAANGAQTHYFGFFPQEFHQGIFPALPQALNNAFSLVVLGLSKLAHAMGLRPSYADLDPLLTLARSLPGLVFLPGLFYGMLRAPMLERIFVGLFLVPVFVAASQERYILGIMPILFFWGVCFWVNLFKRVGGLRP
jgi:hypothetical protein